MVKAGPRLLDRDKIAHDLVRVRGEPLEDRLSGGAARTVGVVCQPAKQAARGLQNDAGVGVIGEAGEQPEGLRQFAREAAHRGRRLAPHALRRIAARQPLQRRQMQRCPFARRPLYAQLPR